MIKLNMHNTALAIGVLVCLVLGYAMHLNYKVKTERLNFEKANAVKEDMRLIQRAEDLKQCKQEAWNSYDRTWDNECASRYQSPGCGLPTYVAEGLGEMKETAEDNCIKLYGN